MYRKYHKQIHKILEKHHPHAVKKARRLFLFKYRKLLFLALAIAFSYFLFTRQFVSSWISSLGNLGYFGILSAGIFNSFGFTSPIGIGLLFTIRPQILILGALMGGIGAAIGDLLIFKAMKYSFMDEFKELEKNKAIKKIEKIIKKNRGVLVRHYLLYLFAGIVIASPLPDEVGVSMVAGLTTIKPFKLALISFISHGIAIFFILYFASLA